jgi:hypothetical protein
MVARNPERGRKFLLLGRNKSLYAFEGSGTSELLKAAFGSKDRGFESRPGANPTNFELTATYNASVVCM